MRCDLGIADPQLAVGNFNPRTYVRCDLAYMHEEQLHALFQSTHLREVRQEINIIVENALLFQSTHLREVRH